MRRFRWLAIVVVFPLALSSQSSNWFAVTGEFRIRGEGRTARSYRPGDDDSYGITRLRLGLELKPVDWFHAFVQGQDSRVFAIPAAHVTTSLKDVFDIRQAWVEFRGGAGAPLALRAGRQELSYGEERLIGASNWGNSGRSFEALKVRMQGSAGWMDVFASSVVVNQPTSFDWHRAGENFHGIYGHFIKIAPQATVEPFVLWKTLPHVKDETGRNGDADLFTYGLRWTGTVAGGWDYTTEMARQGGHAGHDKAGAWAGMWRGGYTNPRPKIKPRIFLEYAYATGDHGRGDGRAGTFDQLYPTNHSYYGTADAVGWRNIRDLRTGVELVSKVKITLDHHFFWLASRYDGLYTDGGGLTVAAPAGGATHTYVGHELDLFASYVAHSSLTLGAGFGHLFPGAFLKDNSPGSATSYPYVLVSYRF